MKEEIRQIGKGYNKAVTSGSRSGSGTGTRTLWQRCGKEVLRRINQETITASTITVKAERKLLEQKQ